MSNLSTHLPDTTRQPDNLANIPSRTVFEVSGNLPDTTRHPPDSLTPPVQVLLSCTAKPATHHFMSGVGCQTRHLARQPDTYPLVSGKPTRLSGNGPDNPTQDKIASCTRFCSYARRRCRVVSGNLPDTLNAVQDGKNGSLSGCRVGWHMLLTPGQEEVSHA